MSQFYGEHPCSEHYKNGKLCRNLAYFRSRTGKLVCGLHVKKHHGSTQLPVNPNKQADLEAKYQRWAEECESVAAANRQQGVRGTVVCTKMGMMRNPVRREGFIMIFPNFKHGGRKDGRGMPALSPKAMGPVVHGQQGLPNALNLENFWQFSKVYGDEVDAKGSPTGVFFSRQIETFLDPVPHRHKPNATGNVPLYWLWKRGNGELVRFKYVQARQFYCNFYERFALKSAEFAQLQDLLENGYNLQLCGYDAYDVTRPLEEHYLDGSRPFGHELVLYSLLTLQNPADYPWRKHKTEQF